MASYLTTLRKKLIENAKDSEHLFIIYGSLTSILFITLYYAYPDTTETTHNNLCLYLIAVLISFPLIITNYWPDKLRSIIPYYWYLSLLYNFPFFFTYMLLNNSQIAEWQFNSLMALSIFMLVTNWLTILILLPIGIMLGVIFYSLNNNEQFLIGKELTHISICYMFILIYGLAFSYKHDSANKEKITSIKALGGIIAHGLRTPLAVITGCAEIIENIIAKLSINTKSSDDFDLETLKRAQSSIENVGLKASTFIDMFLMKIREENYIIEIKEYSIKGVIDDAILSYPINQKEKELIEIRVEEDFKFKGDDLLIKHVLYNLLENALYFIKDAGKGNITIWSKKTYAFNLLHFRDTGKGIKQELKKNIFNKFYTTTKRGTGLGLYFCKLILNELGGDIICASEENVYTEFILKFPAIKGL